MEQFIKDLKEASDRLNALLSDPQEGLFTWHECLDRAIRDINRIYGKEKAA